VPAVTGAEAAEAVARAGLLLGVGRAAEALELVGPLLGAQDDPAPHAVAVGALLALGRPEDAARLADSALAAFGPVPALFRAATHAHLAAGDPPRALVVARYGVEHSPQWVPGLLALAAAARATGDLDAADRAVDAAVPLAPDDPAVWLVAAELAWARRRLRLARRHLRTVLRLDPENVTAMRGLGLLDERGSRFGGAARWYARALRLSPGDRELGDRVRALFGRSLTVVTAALVVIGFVTFVAFMARADPAPGEVEHPLFWPAWTVGLVGSFLGLTWYSLRGAPRVVLRVLAAETRAYRRARRCARLAVAQAVTVAATVLAAVVPVGEPRDRLAVVVLVWLVSMVLMIWQCVALRLAFGFGQDRPVRAHPRDRMPAG
jgi:tetratricopeptide (TPR) repeat protein